MEFHFTKREKILIFINVILCLSLIIVITIGVLRKQADEIEIITKTETEAFSAVPEKSKYVSIKGEVKTPGLIPFTNDERIKDAIDKAGGFTENADANALNLAKLLEDGEEIYVPALQEKAKDEATKTSPPAAKTAKGAEAQKYVASKTNKMNINTANKGQLMALPGIGEALADRIIAYRSGSKFNVIEDIMKVSGIGKGRFEDIKDYIEAY